MKTVYYELTSKLNGREEAPLTMSEPNFRTILDIARKRKSDARYSDVKLNKVTVTSQEIPLVPTAE